MLNTNMASGRGLLFSQGEREPFLCDRLADSELQSGATTLVVVDMQPGFIAALHRPTIEAVVRQIEFAKSRHFAIVILEYDPWKYGPTLPELMRLLDGYERWTLRVKSTDGGAAQVVEACFDFRYAIDSFWVVGVMIDACVEQTVKGLYRALPDCTLRVIQEACNTDYYLDDAWECFPRKDRIVVSLQDLILQRG